MKFEGLDVWQRAVRLRLEKEHLDFVADRVDEFFGVGF